VVKPTGTIDIPSESDLEPFDPDVVDAGEYVVFGPPTYACGSSKVFSVGWEVRSIKSHGNDLTSKR